MKTNKLFYIYLAIWVLVDIVQSLFVEIQSDEAYYAFYGEFLNWGYYDHPPMVALLTHFASLIFKGNLGIRFFTILIHAGTVWLIWAIIADKKANTEKTTIFFIISSSIVMFVAYGFITTPDAPLLFFAAAFLLTYKYFLHANNWIYAIIMGMAMAGMMYSKYHGILIIGLVVLSNLQLLRNPKFWAAGILALFMFIPHIMWQINEGFPSMKYHLMERNTEFKWLFPLEYLPNQMAVFNPFTLGLALYLCWIKHRSKNLFERALIFLIIGFIAFFWVMTIKGHAEPHWTVTAAIPMIIMLYNHAAIDDKIRTYVKRYILPMTFLVIVARIILCTDILPERISFNGKEIKYKSINSVCGNTPVIFTGSFQQASLYRFFTGENSVVLSSLGSRRTEFDIIKPDMQLQGKAAWIMGNGDGSGKKYEIAGYKFECYKTESLQSVNRLEITVESVKIKVGKCMMSLAIKNPYTTDIYFNDEEFPVTCYVAYLYENL